MTKEPPFYVPTLAAQGYCYIARGARVMARIDRPDWIEAFVDYIKANGLPPEADLERVKAGDRAHLADLYRRHLSTDRLRVPFHFADLCGSSGANAPCEYMPKVIAWHKRPPEARDPAPRRSPCHPVDSWEGSDTQAHHHERKRP